MARKKLILPTADTPPEVCETCRFWAEAKADDEGRMGICRRYPPVVFGLASPTGRGVVEERFPTIWPGGWCGEWSAK